jgi:hypothetical protein
MELALSFIRVHDDRPEPFGSFDHASAREKGDRPSCQPEGLIKDASIHA